MLETSMASNRCQRNSIGPTQRESDQKVLIIENTTINNEDESDFSYSLYRKIVKGGEDPTNNNNA